VEAAVQVREVGTQRAMKTFMHVPSEIGAYEAEEIGVEHLLRDVKDAKVSTLADDVLGKVHALRGLEERLKEIRTYLDAVLAGSLPVNHDIMGQLQDMFNLLPNLNLADMVGAFAVKSNDMMLVLYLSSLIRSVVALHNLINNKVVNKESERSHDAMASKEEAKKEAAAAAAAAAAEPKAEDSNADAMDQS